MSESIGILFEQARKQKNLSIKDVADRTKIRKDFLEAFENNDFDIPLPDIYKRGFIKNYASFLGLDVANILASYDAVMSGDQKRLIKQRVNASEWMHQITLEVPSHPQDHPQSEQKPSQNTHSQKLSDLFSSFFQQHSFKWILVACVLAFILLIFIIKWTFFPSPSHQFSTNTENAYQQQHFASNQPIASMESITLYSTGNVHVVVRQEVDKKHIFAGVLHSNTKKVLQKSGPVQVLFSEGSHLLIEGSDGKQLKPNQLGRGWIRVQ